MVSIVRKPGGVPEAGSSAASVVHAIRLGAVVSAAGLTMMSVANAAAADGTASKDAPAIRQCDPYLDYSCLEGYLGDGFLERLLNYYRLEWNQPSGPTDPNAPVGRRDDFPPAAQTTPPMPFTEWPYGAATPLGVTRPSSVDSPLMAALGNTGVGEWMNKNNFQLYGWVNVGANISTNTQKPGGNAPAAYLYTPNTVQLDQAVLYLDRFPDTVQKDHIDWGMRLSVMYGVDYRYTTAYGLASYQLLDRNKITGYDFPMLYGELYIPQVAQGLMLRLGRFISIPDIEAQLAPNNYMYTHSMTYTFDNFTNTGLMATVAVSRNLMLQAGVVAGTESTIGHLKRRVTNPYPNVPGTGPGDVGYNPIYPDSTFKKDPGARASFSGCVRYDTDDGKTDLNACADAINNATYGYNNLNWFGFTFYHQFDEHWHVSFEAYDLYQKKVPNALNSDVQTVYANGGAPFSSRFIPYNAPDQAICDNSVVTTCRASAVGTVAYFNYSPDSRNNFSIRPEYFWDKAGQRTGVKTRYTNLAAGWQHWYSPQVEVRPEVAYYRSLKGAAFNGNANAGIPPTKSTALILSGDIIWHF